MYSPPGSSNGAHAYVEHYDSDGRRLFVMFPGESGRIVYLYNQSQLIEEVSGDRRVKYSDTSSGSVISVVDRDFQSRTEQVTNDGVIFEDKTEYGAKTGLASFRFVYGYNNAMKISSIKGRIGGQVIDYFLDNLTLNCSLYDVDDFLFLFRVIKDLKKNYKLIIKSR